MAEFDVIPIFGMITGMFITVGLIIGVVKVMHSPVGQALARKIQGRGADDEELRTEVTYLKEQVEDMQRQLTETQERMDFAERVLTRGRTAPEDQ